VTNYEEPIKLIWLNSSKSKIDFGVDATIKYLTEILKKCHPTNRQSINEQIELLKENKGETLYQIISDIIKGHEHIEFIQT
jgi:formate dehydrogenase maturation protein FdhE